MELTTFQQLYIEVAENDIAFITKKLNEVALLVYPVGNTIKSLYHCNFSKGAEQEGMPVAKKLIVESLASLFPFSLRPAYAGYPIGCEEPLVNDIGVLKVRSVY